MKSGPFAAVAGTLTMLYDRRWLVAHFIWRQLSHSHRASFLGLSWLFLIPFSMVVLYTLVFSEIIGVRFRVVEGESDTLNFGLYLYCGLIPFINFSSSLSESVTTLRSNATLVNNVVFPVEILPLSATVTGFLTSAIGLGGLVVVAAALGQQLHWTLLLLPLVMVLQFLFILGLSYLAAVLGTYLPDTRAVLGAAMQAMFWITPIIWPQEMVPEHLRFLVDYNPLAYLVDAYRDLILEGSLPGSMEALWFGLFAGSVGAVGFFVFVWLKPGLADLL